MKGNSLDCFTRPGMKFLRRRSQNIAIFLGVRRVAPCSFLGFLFGGEESNFGSVVFEVWYRFNRLPRDRFPEDPGTINRLR